MGGARAWRGACVGESAHGAAREGEYVVGVVPSQAHRWYGNVCVCVCVNVCVHVHQPCGRECLPERRRSTVCGTLCTDHNVPNTDQVLLRAARWCSTGHAARDLGLRHAACSRRVMGRGRGGDVATGVLGWVGRTVGRRRRMMRGRRREAVPACTGRHRGSAVSSASSSIRPAQLAS